MSTQSNNWFETKWATEAHIAYQQKGTKLRNAVRTVTGVVGDTYKFQYLGPVTANTKARDADLTYLNPDHSVKTATLVNKNAAILIDDLDQAKANIDYRRQYVELTASALGRETDTTIITAALSASGLSEVTFDTDIFTTLNAAREELDLSDVDPADRVFVVDPRVISLALDEEKLSSVDYNNVKAVVNGAMDTALGFKWIMSTRLPSAGSPLAVTCFVMHKQAVGLAVGTDIKTKISEIPHKDAWQVHSKLSQGAIRIDDAGVVAFDVTVG
jgi:hypothetical protein